jgi:hypothetical protein
MKCTTHVAIVAAAIAALCVGPVSAQTADKAANPTKATKPSASRVELSSKAKGLALATETVEQVNENQLAIAERVLVGRSSCEFDQSVQVAPVPNKRGFFNVEYKGKSYLMAPEATTTGAVRLEDKKAGMMWLQIANKSMLMNSKIGQRMVDNCVHPSQRA